MLAYQRQSCSPWPLAAAQWFLPLRHRPLYITCLGTLHSVSCSRYVWPSSQNATGGESSRAFTSKSSICSRSKFNLQSWEDIDPVSELLSIQSFEYTHFILFLHGTAPIFINRLTSSLPDLPETWYEDIRRIKHWFLSHNWDPNPWPHAQFSLLKSNLWLGHPCAPLENAPSSTQPCEAPFSLQLHCHKPIALTPVPYQLHSSLSLAPPSPQTPPLISSLHSCPLLLQQTNPAYHLLACPIPSLAAILTLIFPNNSNPNAVSFECLWILLVILAGHAFCVPSWFGIPPWRCIACRCWECRRRRRTGRAAIV